MSGNLVKLAVIGCGDIVMGQHLPTLLEHPSVHVTAVCDKDPVRAAAAGAAFGSSYHTTDHKRILEDKEVQAVLICTPPWATPVITMEALQAGKDVLCEKPMATSLEAAQQMAEAERLSGRLLQVGFTYRHGPLMDALRGWIESDSLGRPLQIRLATFDEVWDPEGNQEHYERILNTLRHGPPCIHDGAHAADHLAFLTGSSPVRITARGLTSRPEFPSPNYNSALIEFANGDQAKLEIGWFYPGFPLGEFQILGPKGMAYLDRAKGEAVLISDRLTERVQLSENRVRSCFRAQLQKFLESIELHQKPIPGSREGISSLRLTLAFVKAMETGESVRISEERET
ncbi:Gfo/Idh/MocA family protein [Paenibacillus sp. V4I5]|uniref:Gfo/Idh/MocA family protein n=1 Tax=Paenibacillus sp. V4I5 TaxID=3042306 RepID=UPI00278D01DE|nr:Gfo/Idh/MocA family oxidoreductase [Paenibacillus sp. V4I5]MDQ0920248.1 myo-inositol 2-dehydrogenase/D-chiro-inositol 1-dehydrogenase [Paenibacillus sp. V4I5]